MKKHLGTFMVILAGVCWGLISIFLKNLNSSGFSSFDVMFVRSWISIIFLFLYFLIVDRNKLKIKIKDIWMFLGSGILSLTFFSFCYFTTILNCGATIGVVLLYTSPIFVMLLSALFFKEKITLKKILALILTFVGCILIAGIIGTSNSITAINFLIGLGAGFGYALYSIFAGFAVKKYSSLTVTFYTFLFSGISLLFMPMFVNPINVILSVNTDNILYFLGVAIVCTVIPYIAYTLGLSKMEKGKAAVLVTVEPLVGTLIGLLIFNEPANIFNITGIILIFTSVIILSLPDKIRTK